MKTTTATSLVWKGDRFEPDAVLPVTDRGVRYGMSLFETLRVRSGRAERVAAHLETLRAACATAGFPDPAAATLSDAWHRLTSEAIPALIAAGSPDALSGTARIYLTAGDGAPDGAVIEPRLFLLFQPRPLPGRDRPALAVRGPRVLAAAHPAGTKSGAYWVNAHALAQSRAEGFDEALLANADGSLRSACMANVFVRLDGRWITPGTTHGPRPGTVRGWVLDRGFAAESTIPAWRADDAEAALLTNSWIGIAPVGRIGTRVVEVPDEVRELAAAFDAVVE